MTSGPDAMRLPILVSRSKTIIELAAAATSFAAEVRRQGPVATAWRETGLAFRKEVDVLILNQWPCAMFQANLPGDREGARSRQTRRQAQGVGGRAPVTECNGARLKDGEGRVAIRASPR